MIVLTKKGLNRIKYDHPVGHWPPKSDHDLERQILGVVRNFVVEDEEDILDIIERPYVNRNDIKRVVRQLFEAKMIDKTEE